MKITKIEGNVKSPGRDWSIEVNEGVNVLCLMGESGGGKTAVANAAELALLKACWVDILGKEIKQGKMIRDRLNGGNDLWAKVHHSKGIGHSAVNITAGAGGRVGSNWHEGWKAPHGANLAATLKDILSRTPAKMVDMLVDLVVRNLKASDIRAAIPDAAAAEYIGTYLTRNNTPLEALNKSLDEGAKALKALNKEMDPLLALANEPVVEPSETRLQSVREERDYWTTQLNLCIAQSNSENNSDVVDDLSSRLLALKSELAGVQADRDALPTVNTAKIEAYEAARQLAKYAAKNSLPLCPLCASPKGIEHEHGKDADYAEVFAKIARRFEGAAERERTRPEFAEREGLNRKAEDLLNRINKLEMQLTFAEGASVVAAPKHSYAEAQQKKEAADKAYDRVLHMKRRWQESQERNETLIRFTEERDAMKSNLEHIKNAKSTLVDAKFGEFLELARSFMPEPQHLKGGVLHVDIEKRQIGFIRNGVLHADPSGSELRTIVIAMALAAGTGMADAPPIFLDDVGWGVELLEAAMNAWTNYKGFVFVPTTAKVRQSKVNARVQVTKIGDITYHLTEEAQPIEVRGEDTTWVQRPEDWGTSMFRLAVEALKPGDRALVRQSIRKGRNWVKQDFEASCIRNNGTNVTFTTPQVGASYTIAVKTGKAPYNGGAEVAALPESVLMKAYRSALSDFLGYTTSSVHITLEQARYIWDNQISAEDYRERAESVIGPLG